MNRYDKLVQGVHVHAETTEIAFSDGISVVLDDDGSLRSVKSGDASFTCPIDPEKLSEHTPTAGSHADLVERLTLAVRIGRQPWIGRKRADLLVKATRAPRPGAGEVARVQGRGAKPRRPRR